MPLNQSFLTYLFLFLTLLPILCFQFDIVNAIVSQIDHCSLLSCDFQRHYLPQVQRFVSEESGFVSGWFYPPLLVFLLYPFHQLPNPEIWWTFFLLTITVCLSHTTHKYSKNVVSPFTSLLFMCISLPVIHCLKWGQISILIVVGLIVALNTRGLWSGIILGFLGALKLYPLLFVLPFLLQKRHQECIAMMISFLIWGILIPLIFMPIDQIIAYYQNAIHASQNIQGMASGLGGQAIIPTATRWFEDGSYGTHVMDGGLIANIPFLSSIFALIVFIPSIFLLYKAPKNTFAPVLTFIFLSLLLSPGWEHYFCFIPYCWLVLYRESSSFQRIVLILMVLLQYVPLLHLLGYGISFFVYAQWGGSTCILLIMLCITWNLQYRYIKDNENQPVPIIPPKLLDC